MFKFINTANPVDKFLVQWNTDLQNSPIGLQTITYSNIADLRKITNSTHAGFVVSLPSSILIQGRQNVSLKYLIKKILKKKK